MICRNAHFLEKEFLEKGGARRKIKLKNKFEAPHIKDVRMDKPI